MFLFDKMSEYDHGNKKANLQFPFTIFKLARLLINPAVQGAIYQSAIDMYLSAGTQ